MRRKDNRDVVNALHRLTEAGEAFVNRSPRLKRIEGQRSALLDAIADAQLVLSVHRLPEEHARSSTSPKEQHSTSFIEKRLKKTLDELERCLRPIGPELEAIQTRAQKAKDLLDGALAKHRDDHDQQAAA